MNTASDPYSTALLITMSMSYSRYFSTAMATATHRPKNASSNSTSKTGALSQFVTICITSKTTQAAATHFSCSRSSPTEWANLTTTAAPLTASAASANENNAVSAGGSA